MTQLPDYRRGDTWPGAVFTTQYNGGAPPTPAASVRLQFRLQTNRNIMEEFSSSKGTLVIEDAAAWTFRAVGRRITTLIPGLYDFALEVTDTDGVVLTTAVGTMKVLEDITR